MTLESSHSRTSTSSTDSEVQSREFQVRDAVLNRDIIRLQELSLLPGGFGNGRKYAWPYLLGCSPSDFTELPSLASSLESLTRPDIRVIPPWRLETSSLNLKHEDSTEQPGNVESHLNPIEANSPSLNSSADLPPHPDEHQVELDTNRSFVLYPVVSSSLKHRKLLQLDLHDIILGVLRKRPKLRYFQGYHDIITVLFLTLPPEYVLPCAEKMSLHRLRDAMGNGLEPLVGQLRVLKRLVRIVDPTYSAVLTKMGHLPYYALSNLLTLFSHDMPTLPLIQHVFDWLLCRDPAASIWLETVIILTKKDEILKLAQEEDDAMGLIHASLTALPPLTDEVLNTEPSAADFNPLSEMGDKTLLSESADLKGVQESKEDVQPDKSSLKEELSEDEMKETSSLSESIPPIFPGAYADNLDKANSTPLSDLLRRAADLFVEYPPSLPDLQISQTFGSASILHMSSNTSADFDPASSILPTLDDDQAEAYVGSEEVMLPLSQEEQDEELGVTQEKEKMREERKEKLAKEKERKKFPVRRRPLSRRQMVVAGTVLLISVAVAMYGLQHPNARKFGFGRNSNAKFMTENFRWLSTSIANLFGTAAKFGILI